MELVAVAGVALMGLGVLTLLVGAARTVTHDWTFGAYEIWAWPLVGGVLLMTGRLLA